MSKETKSDVPFHEAANIFPLLDGDEFDRLVEDIRKYGLRKEIALLDGKVIDGRNRYRACLLASAERRYTEIETDDPVAYVLSLNLHRRHLTPSQQSMVAARAEDVYVEAAKERQKDHAGTAPGKPKSLAANLQQVIPDSGTALEQAAKAVGVSARSAAYGKKVIEHGTPELVKAVDEGRMAVSTAAILATEPPEVQKETLASGKHNRQYGAGPGGVRRGPAENDEPREPEPEPEPGQVRGIGVIQGNLAIDNLKRIPKNDALRKRGFQLVTDWIRINK